MECSVEDGLMVIILPTVCGVDNLVIIDMMRNDGSSATRCIVPSSRLLGRSHSLDGALHLQPSDSFEIWKDSLPFYRGRPFHYDGVVPNSFTYSILIVTLMDSAKQIKLRRLCCYSKNEIGFSTLSW
ncbi:hypothetical protein MTR_2g102223 [Medicago truncatula]|uniref:Uncharacterized protein n=1 Tax=Medicago truncatula TaxID=3880 RepID=A0A072VDP7_MEDTR|nr:hypothetical protein MTR_2g102223 [Medicago truncatula]